MKKRIAFPGSYYDTRRFEAWLGQHAVEGDRFCEFSTNGKITVFEQKEPRRIRYYVEPDFGQYTPEEMEIAYSDLGWTFTEELRGTCLVYETEDTWASRPGTRFEDCNWSRKWRRLILTQLASILLALLSVFLILRTVSDPAAMAGEHRVLIGMLLLCIAAYILKELWPLAASLYDTHIWHRCMRMGEEPDEWKGMVILRWGEVVLVWIILIMIPLTWIFYGFLS